MMLKNKAAKLGRIFEIEKWFFGRAKAINRIQLQQKTSQVQRRT